MMLKKFTCLLGLLFCLGTPLLAEESLIEQEVFEYPRYFGQAENLLAIRPELLEPLLFGLIELKGNKAQSKRMIAKNILGCPQENDYSNCPLLKLKKFKKKHGVPSRYEIPMSYSHVSFTKKGRRTLIDFHWRPKLIDAEIWSLEDFKKYLNLADESPYYRFKPGIGQIIFTPNLEKNLQVTTDNKLGRVLKTLYQAPPQDERDAVIYEVESASVSREGELASFNFYFKAKRVKANHMTFPLLPYKKLRP